MSKIRMTQALTNQKECTKESGQMPTRIIQYAVLAPSAQMPTLELGFSVLPFKKHFYPLMYFLVIKCGYPC